MSSNNMFRNREQYQDTVMAMTFMQCDDESDSNFVTQEQLSVRDDTQIALNTKFKLHINFICEEMREYQNSEISRSALS